MEQGNGRLEETQYVLSSNLPIFLTHSVRQTEIKEGWGLNLPTFQKAAASMRGCIHVRCVATGRALGVPHPLLRVSRLWHLQF